MEKKSLIQIFLIILLFIIALLIFNHFYTSNDSAKNIEKKIIDTEINEKQSVDKNIIENVQYSFNNSKGDIYQVLADFGEINLDNPNLMFLTNVNASLILTNKNYSVDSTSDDNINAEKIMNLKKAGHAGTLDPLASGVLPIALGEATKTMSYAMQTYKAYEFDINWGFATETDDLEGKISNISKVRPSKNEIIRALPNFMGNIRQKPPVFSAIKIDGISVNNEK